MNTERKDHAEQTGDPILAGYMKELGESLTLIESDDLGDLKFVSTLVAPTLTEPATDERKELSTAVLDALAAGLGFQGILVDESGDASADVSDDASALGLPTGAVSADIESADIDDSEFLETKLRNYDLVTDLKTLYPGDHVRVTQNVYQQSNRKCSYVVLKRYDAAGNWWVNSYKPVYGDWKIAVSPPNPHKEVRFYRRREVPHTGKCSRCSRGVKAPYAVCYECRNNN
tara:strand:- start:4693 stop:5382 length:690 start_codon:yes stop_codon:yes gene_type:complete